MSDAPVQACLVADDHPALASVVESFLSANGYSIVGPVSDGLTAVRLAAAELPALALVDYRMPGLGGRELVSRLTTVAPDMKIVVYTADGATIIDEALAAGAAGIVLKEAPLHDLLRALRAVTAGGAYLDPGLGVTAPVAKGRTTLTEREVQSLLRLADGMSQEEIARDLGIGAETVRTHVRKACLRLGVKTKTQAVAAAIRQGVFE